MTPDHATPAPVIAAAPHDPRRRELAELEQRIEALERLPKSASGFTIVRPSDCRALTDALERHLRANRRLFQVHDDTVVAPFLALIDRLVAAAARPYPTEVQFLQVLKGETLHLAGRSAEALELVAPLAERPYRIEGDHGLLARAFLLDTAARLALGRDAEVRRVAYGRLLMLVRARPRSAAALLEHAHPALTLQAPGAPLEQLVRLLARVRHRRVHLAGSRSKRLAVRVAGRLAVIFGSRVLKLEVRLGRTAPVQAETEAAPPLGPDEVLVTRAMGGIGDIAMMTPGLRALAREQGRPVWFATKPAFFPLLAHNPDVQLLDIDGDIPLHRFKRWHDLSDCPAGRHESARRPDIRAGRVELFAQGLGIGRKALDAHGWRPSTPLSPEQVRLRDAFRAEHAGLPIVGVQPFSRDQYKNHPALFEAVRRLAPDHRVVVFHTTPTGAPAHPNVSEFVGRPLADTIAAVAGCDYFISVDSALYHVAAAFDVPCVGVFGPTSGATFSVHHARARLVEAEGFACRPCWRNEDIPCSLTGGMASACLSALGPERIVETLAELKAAWPHTERGEASRAAA